MARTAIDNPFTPGFGNLPAVFAGREREFADLELMVARLAAGIYEQPRMVTGDRGVGKTTLLREFEQEQVEAGRWVVRSSATPGDAIVGRLCERLAQVLHEAAPGEFLAAAAVQALSRLAGVSIGPRGVSIDLEPAVGKVDRAAELERLLTAAAELAREHGTVLILAVDEAQNIARAAIAALFHAVQEVGGKVVESRDEVSGARRRDSLPLAVIVAGLPGLVGHLKAAGSTFGERSKPLRLEVFGPGDVRDALRRFATEGGASFDADAVDVVLAASGGYPYFLHVVGHHVWNAGTGSVITARDARAGVELAQPFMDSFYDERLRDLGERQREYLDAAASLDDRDRTAGAIAAALGMSSSQLASTWQSLTVRHALLRPRGDRGLDFALPGLAAHLRRRTR